jgi:[protein-PII] uridylyltransferase
MPSAARRDHDPVSSFLDTMPMRYREIYDVAAAREHAAIVSRRAGAATHAEIWRRLPRGSAVLCVVADDQPGLLSFISAALVVHGMDVESAQAYTRVGVGEAVDFFWIRRERGAPSPILDADVARIRLVLRGLVTGALTIDGVAASANIECAAPPGVATHVRFDGTSASGLSVLTVETHDRPGLLLAITRALHRARVQIVASEATSQQGRVTDRFTIVELDGAPLRANRRGVLQIEVLSAIDALAQGRTA